MKILITMSAVLFTTSAMAGEFYQAPSSELVNGSINAKMRDRIVSDPNVYQWGPIRVCKVCAPEPFGSYNGRDSSNASTASQEQAASGQGQTAAGDTSPGGDNGASAPSERSDSGKGDRTSRGGEQCAR